MCNQLPTPDAKVAVATFHDHKVRAPPPENALLNRFFWGASLLEILQSLRQSLCTDKYSNICL